MFPRVVIPIPWWIWLILLILGLLVLAWTILTEPDPEPSLKNHLRHLLTLWARDVQRTVVPSSLPPSRSPLPAPSESSHSRSDSRGDSDPRRGRGGFESRGEQICRRHMESRFGVRFDKARPDVLVNPVTGDRLEIDVYNPDLRLGVEYNGRQHYEFHSHFHQSSRDRFQNQQYRDLIKKQLCDEHGIRLIIVPYWIAPEDIPAFLDDQIDALPPPREQENDM